MVERNPLGRRQFTRRRVLIGAAELSAALVALACGLSADKKRPINTTGPEITPTIEQEKLGLWSDNDFEPTFKRLENSVSSMIQLANPQDTMPFCTRGSLLYFAYYDSIFQYGGKFMGVPLMWNFSEPQSRLLSFRNVFIYDNKGYPIASGARSYDFSSQVVAEAKLLNLKDSSSFEIEEVQYVPKTNSQTPIRKVKSYDFYGLTGQVSFRAKSQFLKGIKVSEIVLEGKKNVEYYFKWPSSIAAE